MTIPSGKFDSTDESTVLEPNSVLTNHSVSLLKALYKGNISLKSVYGFYWLGLGIITGLLWCGLCLLSFIPLLLLGESFIETFLQEQDLSEQTLKGWALVQQFKWLALLIIVPLSVIPGYTFYHTALIAWPIWKSLKQLRIKIEKREHPESFWATTGGQVLALLPIGLILMAGLLWGTFWLMVSVLGGPLSILSKAIFFMVGLIPHGLLLGVLFVVPSKKEV